jgi:hypothetical protein
MLPKASLNEAPPTYGTARPSLGYGLARRCRWFKAIRGHQLYRRALLKIIPSGRTLTLNKEFASAGRIAVKIRMSLMTIACIKDH